MEAWINYALLGALVLLLALDAVRPARRFPRMRFWRLKGVGFLAIYVAIATVVPLIVDDWLGAHRLIDARGLGIAGGTVVGVLVVELAIYGWHRLLHGVPFLWRWLHQMHHSAERVDIYGAFYFHPFDLVAFSLLGSLALVWGVGVPVESAILTNAFVTLIGVWQHANVRTPAWIGYVINRPEGHALHHQRGVHAFNYCDIALWDQVFGTWRNPKSWQAEAGFYDGASERVGSMLLGRDISSGSEPRPEPSTAGSIAPPLSSP